MLNPSDVLRMQMDLAAHLEDSSDPSAASLNGLSASQGYQADKSNITSMYAANHVRTGRAYHVTAEMASLVQSRFESLTHLPAVTHCPDDIAPPRVTGFVVMEEPIAYLDIRESVNLAHVLTWGPATGRQGTRPGVQGWAMTMWNDISRRRDDVSTELIREYPTLDRLLNMRWWPCTTMFLAQGQRIGTPYWLATDEDRQAAEDRYARDRAAAALAGSRTAPIPPLRPAVAERTTNLFRYFVALWQLFGEERGPAMTEQTHPQRPALRLARRVLQTSDITVITLRKRPGAHTGTGTPLDHQVPVCQHHRTYWVRDPDHPGQLKRETRIIAEHLRGPHGTRLIVRKKMERLSR